MEDIAPELVEAVTEEFHRLYDDSSRIKSLLGKVNAGTATYAEAQEYSLEVSRIIGVAYEKHISSATLPDGRMYYNIAQRLIPSTLDENHELVSNYAAAVQKELNIKAGIGLNAQSAELDQDRVDGLVDLVSNAEQYDEISGQLRSAIENFSQHIVDETIRKNAEFHHNAGLSPKIVRRAERKCCKWCRGLAGVHNYPAVDRDVYRRHENCRCTVLYDPRDGKLQNVHTKQFTQSQDSAKIESRKVIGVRANGVTIQEVSVHVYDQMAARNVSMDSILDALTNPLDVKPVKYDDQGRPSFAMIGRKATATINPNTGVITTTYPTHTKLANKLLRKKGMR